MKLKHSLIEIPDGDPFANDKLERKVPADVLTQFISSLEEPLTLTIEAGWGHGKSTFLRMWSQRLRNENFSCITFNAWESDFSEDPLIPFVTELMKAISQIDDGTGATKKAFHDLAERLKKTGIQVAKRTLPVAAKLLTAGLIDGEAFTKESAANAIENALEEKFSEYEADKETIDDFRKALLDVVTALRKSGKKLPLVFVIDELDRCRPPFALALLERIKHIFDVEDMAFVIAIDREQLLESIRTVYGPKTDAPRYLRRFVDFGYTLPDPLPEKFPRHLMTIKGLENEFARVNRDNYAGEQFIQTFIALSASFAMRLRDQEHAFSLLSVIWRTSRQGEYLDPFILAIMLILKVVDVEMYNRLVNGEIRAEELIGYIKKHPIGVAFLEENYGYVLEATMYSCLESRSLVEGKFAAMQSAAMAAGGNPVIAKQFHVVKDIYLQSGYKREFSKVVQKLAVTQQFLT